MRALQVVKPARAFQPGCTPLVARRTSRRASGKAMAMGATTGYANVLIIAGPETPELEVRWKPWSSGAGA